MRTVLRPADDDPGVAAVTYGPVVLAGDYGSSALGSLPALDPASVRRTGSTGLAFTATADGREVALKPFHDAHGHTYTVYWRTGGPSSVRVANAASGLVLGIQDMSTADGGRALQWSDSGTADHDWELVPDGGAVRFRNVHSGKVLGVLGMSTADDAAVVQWADNGTADHRWTLLDQGDGTCKIRNAHSGKLLAVAGGSTAVGAFVVQAPDDGTADNRWRILR
jgi:hypothetical protein